ncbi:MAG: 7-cyano-7-deazaguanine synthase [Armatimonadota bacterium]
MPTRVVVSGWADAAAVPFGKAELVLDLHSARRNLTLNLDPLVPSLCPRTHDLVELAAAVYAADIVVPRGRNEAWVRDLEILMPVRELEFWRAHQRVAELLLHELTGDNVALHFGSHEGPWEGDPRGGAEVGPADCVSLLSGGLDSFAGAAALLKTGRQPLLVSHAPGSPTIEGAQRSVVAALRGGFRGSWEHLSLYCGPSRVAEPSADLPRLADREPSQRARSFLFMALAAAAAEASGAGEMYVFENGILAMNVPMSRARVGSMSTRTAHPRVLHTFSELAGAVLGRPLTIANPFAVRTKAEVLRDALRPLVSVDEIRAAVSCWQASRASRACGACVPCLLRRISVLAAGLPDEVYQLDLLADPLSHSGTDALANLVDLAAMAKDFAELDDEALLRTYPELLDGEDHGLSAPLVADLYRRFAAEFFHVLRDHFPAAARVR